MLPKLNAIVCCKFGFQARVRTRYQRPATSAYLNKHWKLRHLFNNLTFSQNALLSLLGKNATPCLSLNLFIGRKEIDIE